MNRGQGGDCLSLGWIREIFYWLIACINGGPLFSASGPSPGQSLRAESWSRMYDGSCAKPLRPLEALGLCKELSDGCICVLPCVCVCVRGYGYLCVWGRQTNFHHLPAGAQFIECALEKTKGARSRYLLFHQPNEIRRGVSHCHIACPG